MKRRSGFTLIELLVVIAIIAICRILFPSSPRLAHARKAACASTCGRSGSRSACMLRTTNRCSCALDRQDGIRTGRAARSYIKRGENRELFKKDYGRSEPLGRPGKMGPPDRSGYGTTFRSWGRWWAKPWEWATSSRRHTSPFPRPGGVSQRQKPSRWVLHMVRTKTGALDTPEAGMPFTHPAGSSGKAAFGNLSGRHGAAPTVSSSMACRCCVANRRIPRAVRPRPGQFGSSAGTVGDAVPGHSGASASVPSGSSAPCWPRNAGAGRGTFNGAGIPAPAPPRCGP